MERMSSPFPRRRALMTTLFAAQVSASTGFTMSLAVGSIMAASITGTNTWSGLPVALGALGGAAASWPLARLMDRFGRRPGLALGYVLAVGGAGLGMLAVMHQSFLLFLVGMALFGIANAPNMLARYAAADISVGRRSAGARWGSSCGSTVARSSANLMDLAVRVGATVACRPSPVLFSSPGRLRTRRRADAGAAPARPARARAAPRAADGGTRRRGGGPGRRDRA